MQLFFLLALGNDSGVSNLLTIRPAFVGVENDTFFLGVEIITPFLVSDSEEIFFVLASSAKG